MTFLANKWYYILPRAFPGLGWTMDLLNSKNDLKYIRKLGKNENIPIFFLLFFPVTNKTKKDPHYNLKDGILSYVNI